MTDTVVAELAAAGFIAAEEEAEELRAAAGGDPEILAALLARRLTGEPLAWITGAVEFCGLVLRVDHGVYVPRWHSEELARRAAARLPDRGVAVDLCTGTGAVAAVLRAARPAARVMGTDLDPAAVACARGNGVEAHAGDLFAPLPTDLRGRVDVLTAVVPYVPTGELGLLQRDTFRFESELPYDGGPEGLALLRRVAAEAGGWLRPGGWVLLESGGDQHQWLGEELARRGFVDVACLRDEDGDVRGVEARRE